MSLINVSVAFISRMLFYGCSILLISCSSDDDPPAIAPDVENFLNEVLDIMEVNAVNRTTINWSDFRARVFNIAGGAQTLDDLDPAMTAALTMLADNHSFFKRPDGSGIFVGTI